MRNKIELNGRKKAAALMVALGPDVSADILRNLGSPEEIEQQIQGPAHTFPQQRITLEHCDIFVAQ